MSRDQSQGKTQKDWDNRSTVARTRTDSDTSENELWVTMVTSPGDEKKDPRKKTPTGEAELLISRTNGG